MNSAYRIPTTPPPEMIISSTSTLRASLTSSYCSYSSKESASSCISKSQVCGLSRSRCVGNLSALGGTASDSSVKVKSQVSYSYKFSPNANEGWGYFVDTPDMKRNGQQLHTALHRCAYWTGDFQRLECVRLIMTYTWALSWQFISAESMGIGILVVCKFDGCTIRKALITLHPYE